MEFRYLGFDQLQNARGYRFEAVSKGDPVRQFVVTVDLALFRTHRVGIQEGPSLCAHKLAADLEKCAETAATEEVHVLTTEDLQIYVDARSAAEARKIEARKGAPRRPKPPIAEAQSPWQRWRA